MNKKKYLIILIKLILIILTYGFIIHKLNSYENLPNILFSIFSFNKLEFLLLFSVICLMCLNWLFEAIKWKYIIRDYEKIDLLKSLKAVFIGISVALFTPNRIGEFGGRILVLKKENRTIGAFSTFIGSTSQLLVTIVLGSVSLSIILLFFENQIQLSDNYRTIIIILLLAVSLISLYLYMNFKLLSRISKYRIFNKWKNHLHIFSSFSKKQLLNILSISVFRYIIFIVQFYILFLVFNSILTFYQSILVITTTYYILAIIPSITLAELGIRGSVIIFFTEIFIPDFAGTLTASIVLWIINLAIPAVFGSILMIKQKV